MLKPPGKPYEVAAQVLKNKGVKVPKREVVEKTKISGPYLQHQRRNEKEENR